MECERVIEEIGKCSRLEQFASDERRRWCGEFCAHGVERIVKTRRLLRRGRDEFRKSCEFLFQPVQVGREHEFRKTAHSVDGSGSGVFPFAEQADGNGLLLCLDSRIRQQLRARDLLDYDGFRKIPKRPCGEAVLLPLLRGGIPRFRLQIVSVHSRLHRGEFAAGCERLVCVVHNLDARLEMGWQTVRRPVGCADFNAVFPAEKCGQFREEFSASRLKLRGDFGDLRLNRHQRFAHAFW